MPVVSGEAGRRALETAIRITEQVERRAAGRREPTPGQVEPTPA
jgi:hypothetical protein